MKKIRYAQPLHDFRILMPQKRNKYVMLRANEKYRIDGEYKSEEDDTHMLVLEIERYHGYVITYPNRFIITEVEVDVDLSASAKSRLSGQDNSINSQW